MNTTRISEKDAEGLAHGRVPSRPDLNPVADLLAEYRSAAIGSAPRPSAALTARLDLSAAPIAMQGDEPGSEPIGVGARRTASGLFGLGVTVAVIFAAASGAAAVGAAGLLPPGAQHAFDDVVSLIVPPGVAGTETTDPGEAPADETPVVPTVRPEDDAQSTPSEQNEPEQEDKPEQQPVSPEVSPSHPDNGNANGAVNGEGNANVNSNGNGNSENAGTGNPHPDNGEDGQSEHGNSENANNGDQGNNGNSDKGNKP